MYKKVLVFIFFLLLTACSNVKETMYSSETKDIVSKTNDLTKEEKDLFQSAVTFAKDNDVDLDGKEVSKIILDEKKRLEDEKKRLEEERKKEEEKKKELQRKKEEEKQKLKDAIQITFYNKSVIPANSDAWQFSDVITFDFTFKNMTNKDIKGFKGLAIFNDLFGDNIKKIKVSYDEVINAETEVDWQGAIEINEFMDNDIKLRDIEFDNLQFDFDMDTIIFSDGTTLTKYGENTQATNTETKDNSAQNTHVKDTKRKVTKIKTKDTNNPYEWVSGGKEKFENKMVQLGYVDSKDNIIYKKYQINDNHEGMYEVYTKVDGKEVYVVVVNVKTGWFHG